MTMPANKDQWRHIVINGHSFARFNYLLCGSSVAYLDFTVRQLKAPVSLSRNNRNQMELRPVSAFITATSTHPLDGLEILVWTNQQLWLTFYYSKDKVPKAQVGTSDRPTVTVSSPISHRLDSELEVWQKGCELRAVPTRMTHNFDCHGGVVLSSARREGRPT